MKKYTKPEMTIAFFKAEEVVLLSAKTTITQNDLGTAVDIVNFN